MQPNPNALRASELSGGQAKLARLIDVSPVVVNQWCKGARPIPAERCVAIEAATDRQVMRWNLRPDDWHRIWPELINTAGAPTVPEIAKAGA